MATTQIRGSNQIKANTVTTDRLNLNTDVEPATDSNVKLGTVTKKWSEVNAVVVNMGDAHFANGWTMTEGDKVGLPDIPLVMVSPVGKKYKFWLEPL